MLLPQLNVHAITVEQEHAMCSGGVTAAAAGATVTCGPVSAGSTATAAAFFDGQRLVSELQKKRV